MALLNFTINNININKICEKSLDKIKIIKKHNNCTLIGPINIINKIETNILNIKPINLFNNLINDTIKITPVKFKININNFETAYQLSKNLFKKELLANRKNETLNFYNNNLINLPLDIELPIRFNKKIGSNYSIQFRRDLFLQNYDFITELNQELKECVMSFEQINKYIWEKKITLKN